MCATNGNDLDVCQSTGAVIVYTSEGDELADGSKAIRSLFDMHCYASQSNRIGTTRREGKIDTNIYNLRAAYESQTQTPTSFKNARMVGSFISDNRPTTTW